MTRRIKIRTPTDQKVDARIVAEALGAELVSDRTLTIWGWREGLNKVQLTLTLRAHGLGLTEAKQAVDGLLDGKPITLRRPEAEAQQLVTEVEALGAEACVIRLRHEFGLEEARAIQTATELIADFPASGGPVRHIQQLQERYDLNLRRAWRLYTEAVRIARLKEHDHPDTPDTPDD